MLEHEAVDDQHVLSLPVAVSVQVKPPHVHEGVQLRLVIDEVERRGEVSPLLCGATLADVLHQRPQLRLPADPGHSHLLLALLSRLHLYADLCSVSA